MTDMTLREHLTALSEKATGGEWAAETQAGDEWWFGGGSGMETVVVTKGGSIVVCVTGGADSPDLVFATALVNAWRDGQLVTREEHERVRAFAESLTDRNDSIGDDARAALNGSN